MHHLCPFGIQPFAYMASICLLQMEMLQRLFMKPINVFLQYIVDLLKYSLLDLEGCTTFLISHISLEN